jgi:hypothetical protein
MSNPTGLVSGLNCRWPRGAPERHSNIRAASMAKIAAPTQSAGRRQTMNNSVMGQIQ